MVLARSFRNFSLALLVLLCLTISGKAADVLLTLPFENVSGRPEYNWVGESFVVLYADLLETPFMQVLDPDERDLVYARLGLQPSDLLTRAAVIRIAETANATLALVGTYDIGSEKENISIAVTARLIEIATGRLVGNKVFTRSGPLSDLQEMQGELAWNILYERNRATTITREQLVNAARGVPPRAYESYVKGIQTQDAKLRETLLRRALQEHAQGGNGHYAEAIYELGLLFYRQHEWDDAGEQFRQLNPDDPRFLESRFYLGLAAYQRGNTADAATAFERMVEPAPLLEVLNNAGAMLFAKGEQPKGLTLLRRAVAQSPGDASYRFNYGYALWKAQNFAEAAQHLKAAAERNPQDGEALFLLAKSLEASGNAAEAAKVDDQAKRSFNNYAKWAVAPDKIPPPFRLKTEFNRAQFFKYQRERAAKQQPATAAPVAVAPVVQITAPPPAANNAPSLERARQLVEARQDNDALGELQRLLSAEATNAEAHYLRGQVLQRRNETENAVSAFQSAVYWNPRHVAAHVALGKIFLARNDRALALTHARQALQIEPQNRDAVALRQQLETGR
jgi:tetratricopeptide (TPR) repeat protein